MNLSLSELSQHSPANWFYDVRDQLKRHVYERSLRAFDAGDAARDAIASHDQLIARQHAIHATLLKGIGGLPASDTPLNARVAGVVNGDGFHVEKVIFESRPRHYVTANLYLPDDLMEPCGAVLFLCGHHREAKHHPEYQSVCQCLVHAGLIVLAQDPIGQGERLSYWEPATGDSTVTWGTEEHDYAGAQCLPLGDGLARYFLHDAMRGIDYLHSRPEVDATRIGVTGNSGGGTQTSLVMMADPRIAAAAPTTFIMDRRSYLFTGGAQDAEQIWPGFSAAGCDHEDILLAMAPKPVRVLAVTSDFFPIEGTRRTVARAKRIWEMCSRGDALDLVEDDSTHLYTPKLARAAAQFFARHLLNKEIDNQLSDVQPLEPSRLWCTTSGQVRGELTDAEFVHEVNRARAAECGAIRSKQFTSQAPDSTLDETAPEGAPAPVDRRGADKSQSLEWLREKVFLHRKPCDLNPRFYLNANVEEWVAQGALWWSQEDICNYGVMLRGVRFYGQTLPMTLAIWDGGTSRLAEHMAWLRRTCDESRAVFVLDTSGVGALLPNSLSTSYAPDARYGVTHKLATDLIWLGDDLVSLRTFDVLRALDLLHIWPGTDASNLRVYAHGKHGVYGRLAAILDSRIAGVDVAEGFTFNEWVSSRHYDDRDTYSIVIPRVLRYFDL